MSRVIREATRSELVSFDSESDLRGYLEPLRQAQEEQMRQAARAQANAESAPAAADAEASTSSGGESITNTQEAGVDEGGIVKTHGDHLVVLRRGRLFSVRVDDQSLQPVSMVDVFPRGAPAGGSWYDEMLIADDTIVVVGYSYGAGATELGLFDINDAGVIRHRSTHFLRSNDYYSSRNYASRLIGNTLIFYMPYSLLSYDWTGNQPRIRTSFPGVRGHDARQDAWNEIIDATEVYRPVQPTPNPVLHTVVTCDLAARDLRCRARGIIGPYGRTFYVSPDAVYVWVTEGYGYEGQERQEVQEAPAVVYRLPLDGSTPGALRVWGVPIDQFSFRQNDGFLNVLVRAEGGGDWMWSPEINSGDVALMRVPVAAFTVGVATVEQRSVYTSLPRPSGEAYAFQNRFVGDHLLYGTGMGWGYADPERQDAAVHVYPYANGGQASTIPLPHGVDRIEVMGRDAVVIGSDGRDLHFTSIELGSSPRVAGSFVQPQASQGETRSHGFFYRAENEDEGVLGLPVMHSGAGGWEHLVNGSAEILFLHVSDSRFARLGALQADAEHTSDDACVMSCVDWYGNARPIFWRGRVFALLGYELVEGRIGDNTIHEVGRTNMLTRLVRQQ